MMSVYYFSIISLVYMILITIAFLTKKKNLTSENIIFSHLILIVLAEVLLDFGNIYLSRNYPESIIYKYCFRLYLIFIIYYVLVFTEYTISLVQTEVEGEEKIIKQNRLCNSVMVFMIFWAILIVYIDQFTQSASHFNSRGFVTTITVTMSMLLLVVWMAILIINKKKLNNQKLVPITIVILSGTIGACAQYLYPNYRLIVPAFVFSLVTLYFTIFPLENPDVKMVNEMEKAKKEADQANKSKTEYLSNVSHEIRTPLNAILGFSQSMLEEDIDDNVKEEVEDIVDASEILLEIVNEILDISKIESNKLEIVNVDYSTEKVYKSLVSMTEGRLGSRQLQFIHNYANDIPPVLLGDYVRIKQIVVNLLTNAIKYTDQGFIKLSFSSERTEEENTIKLRISVTDSGIGIKEEYFDKIFSKFNGLELQKDVAIEGTGLGLSLTKKLVDMMGGKIVVQSKYGEGSTFTVILNQKISEKTLEELELETPKATKNSFVGNGQRILIVDDNAVNLKVALRLMKPYNLDIETLTSSKDCISKIVAGNKYDLVMLDDMMPEMSGVEVLKYLKENIGYNTPTIALTANAISGMKEKYLNDGFTDYLSKPIDKNILEDLLIKYLGNTSSTSKEASNDIKETVNKVVEEV
ncbi:MAG: ATP-binding protein [Bacilli bacterium]|nr:ATP-binding protein [Bacilli bacterium]